MKGRPLGTPNGGELEEDAAEDEFVGFQRHGMAVGQPARAAPVLGSSPTAPVNLSTLAEAAEPASSSTSSNKNSASNSSRMRYRGRFSEVRNPVRRVSSATAALQQRRASLATSVAFHSLLYHLCTFYESNPARRESLFEVSQKFEFIRYSAFHLVCHLWQCFVTDVAKTLRGSAWAVGSYSSGPPAGEIPKILILKTLRQSG